jgi:hypothetical protein
MNRRHLPVLGRHGPGARSLRLWSFAVLGAVLASLAASPRASGQDEGGAAGTAPAPADPVLSGELRFLDPAAGEHYRQGLEEFRKRDYAAAQKSFQKGRRLVKEATEVEIFERLLKEAAAGVELEKIRKSSYSGGKVGAQKALKQLEKAIPTVDKLSLAKDYQTLRWEIVQFLFYVIEDFEDDGAAAGDSTSTDGRPETPSGGGRKGDDSEKEKDSGKTAEPDGGRGGGSGAGPGPGAGPGAGPGPGGGGIGGPGGRGGGRNPFGGRGGWRRELEEALAGGEIQSAKGDPAKVREGSFSYKWPVGKDLRVRIFDFDGKLLKDRKVLNISLRGTKTTATTVDVLLVKKGFDPMRLYLNQFEGYEAHLPVKGVAWKDWKLELDKDFKPKNDPDLESIGHLVLMVRNQPEQVLYLDAIQLER